MAHWQVEYKSNLWSDCISKGHTPVAVAVGGSGITLYCCECKKVWRVAIAGKLWSVLESNLPLVEDCIWKRKVLELMADR